MEAFGGDHYPREVYAGDEPTWQKNNGMWHSPAHTYLAQVESGHHMGVWLARGHSELGQIWAGGPDPSHSDRSYR